MIKRRSIVYLKDLDHFSPYGRVWKMNGNNVTVIDCHKNIEECNVKDLVEVIDYKGYTDPVSGKFVRMPSLRKLKQSASIYHPEVRAR